MADKSFPCREILHSSVHLPQSPSVWALFSLGPYFLVVFYSQWTYIGDGLTSFRPMDMDPSGHLAGPVWPRFYPLQLPPSPLLVRLYLRKGANWGDG